MQFLLVTACVVSDVYHLCKVVLGKLYEVDNYQLCKGVMGIIQDILRMTYSPVSLSRNRLTFTHTPCPGFVLSDGNMQHLQGH